MSKIRTFSAEVHKEDDWYVATCLELGVSSQGRTEEEALTRLVEATELYLEDISDEELAAITEHKDAVLVTFEARLTYA